MNNHTYFSSYIFHSTYMLKYPMISKTENKSKSRVRERQLKLYFNVENLRRDQKP